MNHVIYYFTGTGNSLYLARSLAKKTEAEKVIPIAKAVNEKLPASIDTIGIVCPNYAFNIPHIVKKFIKHLEKNTNTNYIYFVISAGGNNGNVSDRIKKVLKNFRQKAIFTLLMPTNYIPFSAIATLEIQQKRFSEAEIKLDEIAQKVNAKLPHFDKKKDFYKVVIFPGLFYLLAWPMIPKMAKNFWVTDSCNGCEICKKVCPVNNIEMSVGKPQWRDHCEQCFACVHWCPQKSVQYGKNTINRGRYHHPAIKISDMFL